ncbi:hypothetical protein F4679DRAFT_110063 [Xylaria curta]|nr:hypothetical protein F4679DRAFT_110063 [Xylaria curta]
MVPSPVALSNADRSLTAGTRRDTLLCCAMLSVCPPIHCIGHSFMCRPAATDIFRSALLSLNSFVPSHTSDTKCQDQERTLTHLPGLPRGLALGIILSLERMENPVLFAYMSYLLAKHSVSWPYTSFSHRRYACYSRSFLLAQPVFFGKNNRMKNNYIID